MSTGAWNIYPHAGGYFDQDELLLSCIRYVWYTWYINAHKPAHQIPITPADGEFMESLLPKDYTLESGYDKEAARELAGKVNG